MSIALERSINRLEGEVSLRGISSCVPSYGPPQIGGDRNPPSPTAAPIATREAPVLRLGGGLEAVMPPVERGQQVEETSCSSSIGSDSDGSSGSAAASGGDGSGEPEVQSALKRPMDALEEALPIRRGISKFYSGKSKSFTSLADAISSSAKNLAKPENAYTRKRKNLLAFSINWDHHQGAPMRSTTVDSMPKRPANSVRSTEGEHNTPPPQQLLLPPLPPNGKISLPPSCGSPPRRCHLAVRSFSLIDLQGATTTADSLPIISVDKLQQRSH